MNGWDALQAYDLVNDGHGGYNRSRDYSAGRIEWRELILCVRLLFDYNKEARHLAREEGLTSPL